MSFIINPYAYASTPIPIGNLIAYYRFDGDNTDEVNSLDGTTGTGVTYDTGQSGQCVVANGTSTVWTVANDSLLSFGDGADNFNHSFSFYMKTTSTDAEVVSKYTNINTGNEWRITIDPTGPSLVYSIYDPGTFNQRKFISSTNLLTDDTWQHWVFSIDFDGTPKIYLDGSLDVSGWTGTAGTFTATAATSAAVTFARRGWQASRYLNGSIDGFGIWDKALSSGETTSIFNEQSAGNELT